MKNFLRGSFTIFQYHIRFILDHSVRYLNS